MAAVALGSLAGCAQGSFGDSGPATFGLPAGAGSSGSSSDTDTPGMTGPDTGATTGDTTTGASAGSGPDSSGPDSGTPAACLEPTDCDDSDACTDDACIDGMCANEPIVCDDGIDCTLDSCDPELGCESAVDHTQCDDGDACNGTETCDLALGCRAGDDAVTCDDGDVCTVDTCDPQSGACSYPDLDTCANDDGCCVAGCSVQEDNDCSCDNLAPTATPTSSGGGSNNTGYGPNNWTDGVDQAGCQAAGCNQCYGWIDNDASAPGEFMQLQWPSEVVIGSMVLDANSAAAGCLSSVDRRPYSGRVEYFDGNGYVEATTWTAVDGDIIFDFDPPVTTSALRLMDVVTAPGGNNTLAFEWYVYTPPGCRP